MTAEQIEAQARALHAYYSSLYPGLPPWEALDEGKRALNRAQVREFTRLRGRAGDDMEALAAGVHECWMRHQSDPDDPRLVEYSLLPESEKEKDRAVVRALREICAKA